MSGYCSLGQISVQSCGELWMYFMNNMIVIIKGVRNRPFSLQAYCHEIAGKHRFMKLIKVMFHFV